MIGAGRDVLDPEPEVVRQAGAGGRPRGRGRFERDAALLPDTKARSIAGLPGRAQPRQVQMARRDLQEAVDLEHQRRRARTANAPAAADVAGIERRHRRGLAGWAHRPRPPAVRRWWRRR